MIRRIVVREAHLGRSWAFMKSIGWRRIWVMIFRIRRKGLDWESINGAVKRRIKPEPLGYRTGSIAVESSAEKTELIANPLE
jgi:hypothetical protein